LARAHALTLTKPSGAAIGTAQPTTLHTLIRTIVAPYDHRTDEIGSRLAVSGPDIPIAAPCVTGFALLLHEFATNAAKYGALSTATGRIELDCCEDDGGYVLAWREQGGPRIDDRIGDEGFGSHLARAIVKASWVEKFRARQTRRASRFAFWSPAIV
jgi:two-component sensor histidine kinase